MVLLVVVSQLVCLQMPLGKAVPGNGMASHASLDSKPLWCDVSFVTSIRVAFTKINYGMVYTRNRVTVETNSGVTIVLLSN
jgi:hypothetical protein